MGASVFSRNSLTIAAVISAIFTPEYVKWPRREAEAFDQTPIRVRRGPWQVSVLGLLDFDELFAFGKFFNQAVDVLGATFDHSVSNTLGIQRDGLG